MRRGMSWTISLLSIVALSSSAPPVKGPGAPSREPHESRSLQTFDTMYGVDGPFSNAVDETTFNAALLDRGGLCEADGSGCYTDQMADNPSSFYSSRISTHAATIYGIIDFLPGIDLRVVSVERAGNDVSVRFATGAGKTYRVDWRNDLQTGTWATLTNGVTGTGNVMTATDTGGAIVPRRFYRVGLVP